MGTVEPCPGRTDCAWPSAEPRDLSVRRLERFAERFLTSPLDETMTCMGTPALGWASLTLVMALTLAACGEEGDPGPSAADALDAAVTADALPSDALVADARSADAGPPAAPVTMMGRFAVGLRIVSVDYLSPATGEMRTIPVNIWYPTTDASGPQGVYAGVYGDDQVFMDATPAPSVHADGYPVHVHSHGDQGFGGTSAFLMRYFASHGWIAVAPDHVNNTLFDNVDPRPVAHYVHRPLDITHSLNAVATPEAFPSPVVTARVLMSGHSYGCYTTWGIMGATYDQARIDARCAADGDEMPCPGAVREAFRQPLADPRVVAAIPMAGGYRKSWFGEAGYQTVRGPILFMSGSADDVGQADQWEALTGIDYTWIDLEGACHQSFALSICETLAPSEGEALVNAYALAFGRHHILADMEPQVLGLLDGTVTLSEVVSLQRRAP